MTAAHRTMDFFECQDTARKKTFILTLYFILAVGFIIMGVYAALVFAWTRYDESAIGVWHPRLFIGVAIGVIIVVLLGSLFKIMALSKGGASVAEMLGAAPVDPNTNDPHHRRLLNVVEEMAIASGVPVPQVFLLGREDGINAFAAGYTPGSAVVAVTRGCVTHLTRDELQGVVAHEFSHILNGDMQLNIRLIGIIAGILVIGTIGRVIARTTSSGRSRSSGKKGGGAGAIAMMGLIIMAVGYIGVFFGKLIKSAVSRQREFLADASAVQFTRNPSGIARALKKIAALKAGSRIHNIHAEEASHLFFSNGLKKAFLGLLATHPPLDERIRRIDPSVAEMEYRAVWKEAEVDEAPGVQGVSFAAPQADGMPGEAHGIRVPPEQLTSMVGAPQYEHLAYASHLVSDLPAEVAEAAREPFGARALIYCLLLNSEGGARKVQLERLEDNADHAVMVETRVLLPIIDSAGAEYRLPLVDLAIPALKLLSPNQYRSFRINVKDLAEADKRINIFEYALQRIVIRHVDPVFKKVPPPTVKYHVIDQVQVECFILLSTLAWRGGSEKSIAAESFRRGSAELGIEITPAILAAEKCTMKNMDTALRRLSAASPGIKKDILRACMACISADSVVSVEEAEMVRAIAASLDCPIPPIIPVHGQARD